MGRRRVFAGVLALPLVAGCGHSTSPMSTATGMMPSPAAQTVTAYLNAVQAGDCTTAEKYTVHASFGGDGDLCVGQSVGPIRFDRWRADPKAPPTHPSPGVYEYAIQIHVTALGPAAGGIGSTGWNIWFLEAKKQADGYRLVAGGSGP